MKKRGLSTNRNFNPNPNGGTKVQWRLSKLATLSCLFTWLLYPALHDKGSLVYGKDGQGKVEAPPLIISVKVYNF